MSNLKTNSIDLSTYLTDPVSVITLLESKQTTWRAKRTTSSGVNRLNRRCISKTNSVTVTASKKLYVCIERDVLAKGNELHLF